MSQTSHDTPERVRERVRFTVSAATAVKFGFFAAVGLTGFLVLLGGLFAVAIFALAAAGFFTLPVGGR